MKIGGCFISSWRSRQSRPIKISQSVEINFWNLLRFILNVKTRLFFVSVEIIKIKAFESRLSCVKIFIKILKINRDCWDFQDLLRLFKIYWNISTLLRLFEGLQKSWQIEKSWSSQVIKSTNSWLRLRQTFKIYQNFRSRWIPRSWSRLLGLEGGIKTIKISWSRDKLFETVKIFSTVET